MLWKAKPELGVQKLLPLFGLQLELVYPSTTSQTRYGCTIRQIVKPTANGRIISSLDIDIIASVPRNAKSNRRRPQGTSVV